MEVQYFIPQEDKDLIVSLLNIDPFNGNIISKKAIQMYDDIGVSINEACAEIFGQDLYQRYEEYVDPNQLRVFRSLNMDANPLTSDFTILGFRKQSPYYDRGRKRSAEYICSTNEDLIVRKIFRDVFDDVGNLIALEVTFEWYNESNELALRKVEVVENFSKAKAKTVLRERRYKAMDFLESEAEGTPLEPVMVHLLEFFDSEVRHWKENGSLEFKNALLNVTDPTTMYYLNIKVPLTSIPSVQTEVLNSILYQIGALSDIEFLTTTELVEE